MSTIELVGVCSGYGKKTVLSDINTSFEKGKVTAIIGPNGSGKTTLLKTALGNIPPISGKILADGENISDLKPKQRAKKISYLSQEKTVPDMTVFQLVLQGRFPHTGFAGRYSEKDTRAAMQSIEKMGLSEHADTHISTLSGGMRQKAYIAMTLAQETDYIFCDEPTTYLDIYHRLELMDTLKELAKGGKGVVMVLHDIPLALEYADRVIVMKDGKILSCASPDDISGSNILKTAFNIELERVTVNGTYAYCHRKIGGEK